VVVGSGTRFLSGITVYTVRLAEALADAGVRASVVTMRQLLPTFLYPGKARVGTDLTDLGDRGKVPTFDGIDWWWLPSLALAARFLRRQRPDTIVLQWWTGTVFHSYLALSLLARALSARVVIEFHEVQDTGELRLPLVSRYSHLVGAAVIRLAAGYTVHSEFDRDLLARHWDLRGKPVAVLPHGPYDHYQAKGAPVPAAREAPADVCNILFFGIIRPYKGLEDLIAAFERLSPTEVTGYWLTVVGETWEGHTLPSEMIARSPYRDRITFVNRYVHDSELDAYLRGADAAVLPYRRSSLSGPLHVAMGYGVPIVLTETGGNIESADGYAGILLMPVGDVVALTERLRELPALRGTRFEHPRSWSATADAYARFLDTIEAADAGWGSTTDQAT
jgi:glycosyltransferase involved in cell wall biosynthesis